MLSKQTSNPNFSLSSSNNFSLSSSQKELDSSVNYLLPYYKSDKWCSIFKQKINSLVNECSTQPTLKLFNAKDRTACTSQHAQATTSNDLSEHTKQCFINSRLPNGNTKPSFMFPSIYVDEGFVKEEYVPFQPPERQFVNQLYDLQMKNLNKLYNRTGTKWRARSKQNANVNVNVNEINKHFYQTHINFRNRQNLVNDGDKAVQAGNEDYFNRTGMNVVKRKYLDYIKQKSNNDYIKYYYGI